MSNFTPLVTKEYDFDGDHIKVTFSRLTRKHMLAAMPAFKRMADSDEDSPERIEVINDVLNDIVDVIPKYVKSFDGLNDAEGNHIGIEIVINDMYFMRLAVLIASDMMRESSVPGGNE